MDQGHKNNENSLHEYVSHLTLFLSYNNFCTLVTRGCLLLNIRSAQNGISIVRSNRSHICIKFFHCFCVSHLSLKWVLDVTIHPNFSHLQRANYIYMYIYTLHYYFSNLRILSREKILSINWHHLKIFRWLWSETSAIFSLHRNRISFVIAFIASKSCADVNNFIS